MCLLGGIFGRNCLVEGKWGPDHEVGEKEKEVVGLHGCFM